MADADPAPPIRILLLEDSEIDAELLSGHLAKDRLAVSIERVVTRQEFIDALRRDGVDVILSDFSLPDFDGLAALDLAQALQPQTPFVFVSGIIGEEFATNALKRGATDYILKRNLSRVPTAIERALFDARQKEERRAALAALRLSEQNLQNALKAGNFGTWSLDLRTEAFTTSSVCKQNFGRDVETPFSYEQLRDAVHPEDRVRMQAAVDESIVSGADYNIEYRIITPSSEVRWVSVRGQAAAGEDGAARTMAGVSADITVRKRLEQDLLSLNEDLERRVEARTAELVEAQEALRQSQKMEAIGQLTGGIAHDFNNLLTGITGSLDLISRRLEAGRTDGIDRFMSAAKLSANRAAALTHRLLAFARRQSLLTEAQDVNGIVASMEEMFRRTLGETIRMEMVLDQDLWPGLSDANQLENALLNLVINARDAMPDGGDLTISTRKAQVDAVMAIRQNVDAGDYVVLAVTDTGVGMPADVLAKAFDPFFTTKPIGQGTGLGLSMIYGFAKQTGGFVAIDSAPDLGTTVRIYLPTATTAMQKPPDSPPVAPAGDGETVLVVEDDPTVRLLIIEVLQELGYNHVEAEDGDTAIPFLQSDMHIDLLVTDVGLPNLNGRQLAEIARQQRPGLKILFVTGYAEGAAHREGFLEEGMSMMTKPFDLDALAAKIRALIKGRCS